MTELRQKMLRAMDLKNLSNHTKRAYLTAVTGLANHFHTSPKFITEEMIEDCVRKSLGFVGLDNSVDLMPAELSGGMKKRVAIARGIVAEPKIMLYDEPTAGLDPINASNINMLINRLNQEEGVTSVVVTHDLQTAFSVATRTALIHEGELVFVGDREGLMKSGDDRVRNFLRHAGHTTRDALVE